MDDNIKKELLNEAERIGDNLLSLADNDENGMSWNISTLEPDNSFKIHKFENIFTGVSGVLLFLIELYKLSQKEKYLGAAVEGTRWLENYCRHEPSTFYSFLNGRMGVSYTFLKMFETTRDNRYLNLALTTAEGCLDFMKDYRLASYWLNGVSGTIMGLLHLHNASGEKWLLEKIDSFIRYLLDNSHPGPQGVYWDRSFNNISGLCGFSNGASGIGFVLLELGHYFNNDAFYWLAEQAFLYESCFYDESSKNWQDLRLVFNKYEDYKTHENAYLKGDMDFFTRKGSDINNWIYGAAGIGITRLHAFDLLKKPIYKQEAQNALEKTLQTMHTAPKNDQISRMFTLAEGEAGYAELFLQAAAIFNDPHYLTQAESIAVKTLAYWQKHHYYPSGLRFDNKQGNSSLFMGDPGIGYLYLRVLEPLKVPSILLPKPGINTVDRQSKSPTLPYISISLPDIKKKILNRYFKRSIMLCEKFLPHDLEVFLSHDDRKKVGNSVLKEEFNTFLEHILPSLPPQQRETMSEIATLEMDLKKMDENIPSHNLLYIKERLLQRDAEKWRNMETGAIMELFLELDKDVRLHACSFQWERHLNEMPVESLKNTDREPGQYFVLLKAEAMGISENTLSPFAYAILTEFQESKKVSETIPLIIDSFGEISADEKELINGEIISQIKEMLAAGILVKRSFIITSDIFFDSQGTGNAGQF